MKYVLIFLIIVSALLQAQMFTRIYEGDIVTDEDNSFCSAWADVDNDEDLDLFVSNYGNNNCLYLNNGDGSFDKLQTGSIVNDGGTSLSGFWIDYDNDTLLDMFVTNDHTSSNFLYKNLGNGNFNRITNSPILSGNYYYHSEWSDYDKNGVIDIFLCNARANSFDKLFKGTNSGTFIEVDNEYWQQDGTKSVSANWIDLNNDSFLDLYISKTYGIDNRLYFNLQDDGFLPMNQDESVIVSDQGYSNSSNWIDYDNDGDFDLFVVNSNYQRNCLYRNDGNLNFNKILDTPLYTEESNTRSAGWGDYDNDGDIDVFIANGFWDEDRLNYLYNNDGFGNFELIENDAMCSDETNSIGCNWVDYDNDGDLDLFVANGTSYVVSKNCFYKNEGNKNNWVKIKLLGTQSDSYALGAVLKIKAIISDEPVWQIRHVSSSTGRASQCGYFAHFGMGDAAFADSLIIKWPSGNIETFTDIAANQTLYVTEQNTNSVQNVVSSDRVLLTNYPNPFNPSTTISFSLSNEQNQQNEQILLDIYNVKGQKVDTLPVILNGIEGAVTWNAEHYSSGIYFYKLVVDNEVIATKKMMLIK
jgi:enediyne biosynthesis protein E4